MLTLLTAGIIFGGIHRIARVSSVIVPVMALGYIILALGIVLWNIGRLPEVLHLILSEAFGWNQALGGGIGAALMQGIKRGLFSNEAGMGSAPERCGHGPRLASRQAGTHPDARSLHRHAAHLHLHGLHHPLRRHPRPDAQRHPAHAGGPRLGSGARGELFVAVAIFLFAFSSIIGNYYYGEANIRFITPRRGVLMVYRLLVAAMVLFGALATLDVVWNLADVTMALMTLCNLVAIVWLGGEAFRLLGTTSPSAGA